MFVRVDRALVSLLTISLCFNIYAAYRLRASPRRLHEQQTLRPGSPMPIVHAKDMRGRSVELRFNDGRRHVFYVFSPQCRFCRENTSNIGALALASKSSDFEAVALSEDGLEDYVRNSEWSFPVFRQPSEASLRALAVGAVPMTIVVDDGRVTASWTGTYDAAPERRRIAELFGVELPQRIGGEKLRVTSASESSAGPQ